MTPRGGQKIRQRAARLLANSYGSQLCQCSFARGANARDLRGCRELLGKDGTLSFIITIISIIIIVIIIMIRSIIIIVTIKGFAWLDESVLARVVQYIASTCNTAYYSLL